jgi:hypothetical protein
LFEGLKEAGALANATVRAFGRKLAGTSRYDGLPLFIARTYASLETGSPPPVSLDEIDAVAKLVAAFSEPELML